MAKRRIPQLTDEQRKANEERRAAYAAEEEAHRLASQQAEEIRKQENELFRIRAKEINEQKERERYESIMEKYKEKAMPQQTQRRYKALPPEEEVVNNAPVEEEVNIEEEAPMEQDGMEEGNEEKYSMQVLRRMHEDALMLLEEYDEMREQLEHPEIDNHMLQKLEALVAEIEEIEALQGTHHPEASPLGDHAMEGGVDEGSGMDTEDMAQEPPPEAGIQEPEMDEEEAARATFDTKSLRMQLHKALRNHYGRKSICPKCGIEPCECAEGEDTEAFPEAEAQDEATGVTQEESNSEDMPFGEHHLGILDETSNHLEKKMAHPAYGHTLEDQRIASEKAGLLHSIIREIDQQAMGDGLGIEEGHVPGAGADMAEVESGHMPELKKSLKGRMDKQDANIEVNEPGEKGKKRPQVEILEVLPHQAGERKQPSEARGNVEYDKREMKALHYTANKGARSKPRSGIGMRGRYKALEGAHQFLQKMSKSLAWKKGVHDHEAWGHGKALRHIVDDHKDMGMEDGGAAAPEGNVGAVGEKSLDLSQKSFEILKNRTLQQSEQLAKITEALLSETNGTH